MTMVYTVKDDVTKNRLSELTDMLKGKMQERIGCNESDMDFWFVALALQCTRIYMKYHMEDLDVMRETYAEHPIIGLPFRVVGELFKVNDMKVAFEQANLTACEDVTLVAEATIHQLAVIGEQVYARYGLPIVEDSCVDDEIMNSLAAYLNDWALMRKKKREDLGTLFDLIVCIVYFLLQNRKNANFGLHINNLLMYSNSVASFSDYFWTANHTAYGRMEGILHMSINDFAGSIDRLFYEETFVREVLLEYLYIVNRGHEGTLL